MQRLATRAIRAIHTAGEPEHAKHVSYDHAVVVDYDANHVCGARDPKGIAPSNC